jgi:hypothetical protein
MRAMKDAFTRVPIAPGQRLTPLHRTILRVMERQEKYRQQRKQTKAR